MSGRLEIQQIITGWKKQTNKAERQAYLEKVRTGLNDMNEDELLAVAKAINEAVQDLHHEVFPPWMSQNLLKFFPPMQKKQN